MVEVFKTNVVHTDVAQAVIENLRSQFPQSRINFDLSDCDRILRVEAENVCCERIIEVVRASGYQVEIL
jgi:hypothetical protein